MRRNIEIVKFESKYAEDAAKLAKNCYLEECKHVPELPLEVDIPNPSRYVENGLGVAALTDGNLVGFFCCLTPWNNFFGTSKGTYVPVNAHGAVKEDRKRIYSRLYEEAADVWVKNGILSHAVGVYSHAQDAVNSFFWNGFGMRTIDAVRSLESIEESLPAGNITFKELEKDRYGEIHPLRSGIISHLNKSPMFMPHRQDSKDQFLKYISNGIQDCQIGLCLLNLNMHMMPLDVKL